MLSWNELWDFITELRRDPSSHLSSAMHGDKYVPHAAERAAYAVFEQDLNTRLAQGTPRKRVPRPWAGTRPTYRDAAEPQMTPERIARRRTLDALF